jgi:hypothetical protein
VNFPLLAASLIAFFATSLRADVSPIRLDIEQTGKTKAASVRLGKPDPSHGSKTQIRALTIRLSNGSSESFDNLIVKYWFLGHSMKGHDITVLKSGQRKSALSPHGGDVVESESVASTYVEQHSEVSKSKGSSRGRSRKGTRSKVSKVPASGEKLVGYAVQVLDGGKVVADFYSEESYRDIVAKDVALKSSASAQAAGGPKKKKKK